MNYNFSDEFIHDDDAMWDFALTVQVRYGFLVEQVERSQTKSSILSEGHIVMKWDSDYKKILADYEKELHFMNQLIEFILIQKGSKIAKYLNVCT